MKYKAKIKNENGDTWWEFFEETTKTPLEDTIKLVEEYNETGRSKFKREVIGIRITDRTDRLKHNWRKSNLVTQQDRFGTYDSRRCKNCGITGKIRCLGGTVQIDKKYQKHDPIFCKS